MQLLIAAIILSLFIIRLPFSVKCYISFYDKKLYLNILIFRFIKVKSCYLNYKKGEIFLHLSDKKAIAFGIREVIPKKNNMGFLHIFKFEKFKYALISNIEDNFAEYFVLFFLNNFNAVFYCVIKELYPKFVFNGNILVCRETRIRGVLCEICGKFGLLTAVKGLICSR